MLKLKHVEDTLHIWISGQLRISMVYELTDALIRFADSCAQYCLDLHDVDQLSDGALAVLTMFASHARRHGQHIRLINCSKELTQRIAQLPALQELLQPSHDLEPESQAVQPLQQQHIQYKFCRVSQAVRGPLAFT